MRTHSSTLISRMIQKGLKSRCRYKVVAAGIDHRGRILSICSNSPRIENRGYHAEERVIFSSPKSLSKIVIIRVNGNGQLMPIDPCMKCYSLAEQRCIKIVSIR